MHRHHCLWPLKNMPTLNFMDDNTTFGYIVQMCDFWSVWELEERRLARMLSSIYSCRACAVGYYCLWQVKQHHIIILLKHIWKYSYNFGSFVMFVVSWFQPISKENACKPKRKLSQIDSKQLVCYRLEMGRRKSKRKPPPKKKLTGNLDTQFTCPFCNHEKSCDVKM